jgi:hypothetical protein
VASRQDNGISGSPDLNQGLGSMSSVYVSDGIPLPEYWSTFRSFGGYNMSIIVRASLFSVCRVLKQSRVSSSLVRIRSDTALASD